MLYYKVIKKSTRTIVGIGNTQDKSIPANCSLYSFKKITKEEYNKLNDKEF